jgi:transcriptional repressor NrdR
MVCIYCGNETKVTNSRHQRRANQVWRRRSCIECGAIFSTTEYIDLSKTISLRRKTQLEPFSRESLLVSLYDSLRHRSDALADATAITSTIISQLPPLIIDAAIDRNDLVAIATETLSRFDNVAATHYAAFHPV